jgi:hypothetical protein
LEGVEQSCAVNASGILELLYCQAEGPNDERRRNVAKRDGTESDHLRKQAAAMPRDQLVDGLPRQPESIHACALFAQVPIPIRRHSGHDERYVCYRTKKVSVPE